MPTPRPDTRSRLVDSACQLFYAHGYHGTSLAAVAARAEANPGSLYYFFKTKQELLLAVLSRYRQLLGPVVAEPAFASTGDPVERVFAMLAVYRELLRATSCAAGCPIGNLALELKDAESEVQGGIVANFDDWCGEVERCLELAADRLPPEVDRRRLSRFVLTVMEGAVLQARGRGSLGAFDDAVTELRGYFDLLLGRQTATAGGEGDPSRPEGSAGTGAADRGDDMNRAFAILGGLALFGSALSAAGPAEGDGAERVLRKEVVIEAPLEVVWRAWTSEEGLRVVSPDSRVELRPGGAYAWFLQGEPDAFGRRGSEGSRIVSFEPRRELVFDWTFSPHTPGLRASGATTRVVVRFDPVGEGGTRVRLVVSGWQQGEEWEQGFEYFDRAWEWVLREMKRGLEGASEW